MGEFWPSKNAGLAPKPQHMSEMCVYAVTLILLVFDILSFVASLH